MEPKEQRKIDDFILYAVAAAAQALADAGWKPSTYEEQIKTGVLIGSGIGGLGGIAETAIVLKEKGPRRVSPFFIPGRLINLAGGYVSIQHGLKGPNHAVVTACSTGNACDWRRGAPGRLGRCRSHGRGGRRIGDQSHRHRRIRRLPGPIHGFQRPAKTSLAALR